MMEKDKWQEANAFVRTLDSLRPQRWNGLLKGVSHHEFGFLMMILRFQQQHPEVKGIYVNELAKNMRITKSAVSKMLGNLERRELVERAVDPDNRRNTFVFLTEQGAELCEMQHERLRQFLQQVAAELGEQRYREILDGIQELSDAMAAVMASWEPQNQTKEETRCDLFCDT